MEFFGAISTGDHWRSSNLNEIYSSQEVDYHLPSDCAVPHYDLNHIVANSGLEIPFTIWPSNDSTIVHDMASADEIRTNLNYHQFTNLASSLEFCEGQSADELLNNFRNDDNNNHEWISINQDIPQFKWESDHVMSTMEPNQSAWNPKKRPRSSLPNDDQGLKNKRNTKPRKVVERVAGCETDEDDNAGIVRRPISQISPLSAGEHSNASQEQLGGTTSSSSPKGKRTRATRACSTDPQSVYARKRRQKINERLKVLQNLVPNGTKVDISTMLEEAVQYVKFLQLQIKLLSSDDLWMYAPLAYNGMDIGVDRLRLTAQGLL